MKLAPSLLAADMLHIGDELDKIKAAGIDMLHIDIMDGHFVPNISLGFPIIKSMRSYTDLDFDVHLMIYNPEHYIQVAKDSGANSITVHAECSDHLHRVVSQIKDCGCKAGVALSPATSLSTLDYIIQDVDVVLLMTVDPGFGGQKLIPGMYQKIRDLRDMIREKDSKAVIQLDGGVTVDNAKACVEAGAEILVAGTAVFRGDVAENIRRFSQR